jgi:hypothetical protein
MKKNIPLLTLLSLFLATATFAQSKSDWLFDDQVLPEVHISIDTTDLALILENPFSDVEYPATFVFMKGEQADTVEQIGFRIRGNTSRASDKKSFKVSFNTFVDGREYRDLDKMNLNGEHNDPSIMRSKLSWDLFAKAGVIAPRSNHVKLYINEAYYGLYMNVEHIDNEFIKKNFEGEVGNLYKSLYPSDLTFLGNNAEDYKRESGGRRIYELTTNEEEDDYTHLAEFIRFINRSSDADFEAQIRDFIHVDGVIRVMAVDILTGMWDNYMFNKNNYYLYDNPQTGRFEFIPFDYDNTFGIDWFNIDWGTRSIDDWGNGWESRPLTDRLFAIPKYRHRLHYYLNLFMDEYFNTTVLYPEIDRLKAMIQEAAEADEYRTLDYTFSVDDFNNSFDQALGDHVKYGLKPYIETRVNSAKNQLVLENIVPVFTSAHIEPTYDEEGKKLILTASVFDDDAVSVTALLSGSINQELTLTDNGLNGDVLLGDGIFTAAIAVDEIDGELNIELLATDENAHSERFPHNPANFLTVELTAQNEDVLINELMASNSNTIQDEQGSYPDWVELYNPLNEPLNLSGYYLTDDLSEPDKWAFPDTSIAPNGFLLIWVDDDEEDGPLHASFNLSKGGEDVGVFKMMGGELVSVDALTYDEQETDISYGRQFDGSSNFVLISEPTPGTSNGTQTSIQEPESDQPAAFQLYQNYPNPFNPVTTIQFELDQSSELLLQVFSVDGRLLQTLANDRFSSGLHTFRFSGDRLASGLYFYRLTANGTSITRSMTLLK